MLEHQPRAKVWTYDFGSAQVRPFEAIPEGCIPCVGNFEFSRVPDICERGFNILVFGRTVAAKARQ